MVDADGFLRGLITIKDLQKRTDFPNATKDAEGRLRVAAAVGTGADVFDRAKALIDAGVDALVVDTAHGHATSVAETVREMRRHRGTARSSPATSPPPRRPRRSSTPAPTPSRSASAPARSARPASSPASAFPRSPPCSTAPRSRRRRGVSVIADGGIQFSGDVAKAIAAGADCAMFG